MHKTMSRIVVLLLVVCLALGNVVPALAADDTGSAGAVTPAAETSPAASGAFTYSYLYFGTRTDLVAQLDAGGAFGVVAGVAGTSTQTYHFTLPESAAGTRVPVCILKSDLTARSPYNSSELELIVPADIPPRRRQSRPPRRNRQFPRR